MRALILLARVDQWRRDVGKFIRERGKGDTGRSNDDHDDDDEDDDTMTTVTATTRERIRRR